MPFLLQNRRQVRENQVKHGSTFILHFSIQYSLFISVRKKRIDSSKSVAKRIFSHRIALNGDRILLYSQRVCVPEPVYERKWEKRAQHIVIAHRVPFRSI